MVKNNKIKLLLSLGCALHCGMVYSSACHNKGCNPGSEKYEQERPSCSADFDESEQQRQIKLKNLWGCIQSFQKQQSKNEITSKQLIEKLQKVQEELQANQGSGYTLEQINFWVKPIRIELMRLLKIHEKESNKPVNDPTPPTI